jgi:hypothetical protein
MGVLSIIKRKHRRVGPTEDKICGTYNDNKKLCLCRKCKKRRRKELNTASICLCPLLGIIALITAIG